MMRRAVAPPGRAYRQTRQDIRDGESPVLETVRLANINRSDEFFSMSFEPDFGPLKESVKQLGVLEPVWLRERARGFQIINGFRRYDVAQTLGMKLIRAMIWREDQIDDRLAFQMSLHGNMLTRGLNIVEKSLVLEKLSSRFSIDKDEVIETWLPALELEPNEKVLNSFLQIPPFSTSLKRYVVSRGLSLNNILRLATLSEEDRESMCGLLLSLRMGENVLREILTFLKEISARDGIGISGLVSNREMQRILSDSRLSGPQKVQAVRRVLREKRYPRLSDLEERLRACRKGMKISPQIGIIPPPLFEGDRFKIEFHFRTLREYETHLGMLQKLPKERIRDLLRIKGYGDDTL